MNLDPLPNALPARGLCWRPVAAGPMTDGTSLDGGGGFMRKLPPRSALALLLLGGSVALACSSSGAVDSAVHDSAASADSAASPDSSVGADGPGGGGACNALTPQGGVNPIVERGEPPTMTGGAIADGTWLMTEKILYVPADSKLASGGAPESTVQQFSGSVLQVGYTINGGGEEGARGHYTYGPLIFDGSTLSARLTCGSVEDFSVTYTADGDTLKELWPSNEDGVRFLRIFTRQ
jgi:hypothetical protein